MVGREHALRDGIPAHTEDIGRTQGKRPETVLIQHSLHRRQRVWLRVHEGPVHVEQDPIDIVEVHVAMLWAAFSISACRRPANPLGSSSLPSAMDAWSSSSLAKGSSPA